MDNLLLLTAVCVSVVSSVVPSEGRANLEIEMSGSSGIDSPVPVLFQLI